MSTHQRISKEERLQVYNKYDGHCAYCGCELQYKDMQVDHIKSVYKYTDNSKQMTHKEMYSLINYMPSCRQCNFYKSTFDLEEFRERLTDILLSNLQKDFNYRLCLKYGLIKENTEIERPIKFYFEKFHKPL